MNMWINNGEEMINLSQCTRLYINTKTCTIEADGCNGANYAVWVDYEEEFLQDTYNNICKAIAEGKSYCEIIEGEVVCD